MASRALGVALAAAGGLGVVAALAAPPAMASAMELRLLGYNVHGTAPIVNRIRSSPRERMRAIAGQLARYDLVALQEDFAYHDALTHPFDPARIERGRGPTFRWGYVATAPAWLPFLLLFNVTAWPLFYGDGLTIVAVDPALVVERLASERYARCGDYFVGGNDCFAAKGFLAVRVTLPNGAAVDVYDTHLEAGREGFLRGRDQEVRRTQLAELAAAIDRLSPERAVIVLGDLNADARSATAFAPVEELMRSAGLTDAGGWKRLGAPWVRRLDHVLYRDGTGAMLGTPVVDEDRRFVTVDERPLSDHPAMAAVFTVEPWPTPR